MSESRKPPVAVVATIVPEPAHRQLVEDALRQAVAQVRLEPGCEYYELHRDLDDAGRFVMLERWRDEDALAQHGRGAALAALGKVLEGRASLHIVKLAAVA
ncbi:putative quinol monooxygenase [Cupriavidus sp. 30B13]|uniref:putative quinol monooxygenase n=1 Tax=Cupriavidus sp. 30B13 TaxID=3384241 RepID=UPI003B901043